jgi:hypothetical protein
VLGLILISCGADDADEPEPEPTVVEQLDACGLPSPCSPWIGWNGCASYEDVTYADQDVCSLAALAGDEPTVIRAYFVVPSCGDLMSSNDMNIYRWADGSMTCVVTDSTGQAGGAVACSLADAAPIEGCLAAAQAGEEVTEACLNWHMWGLELGDPVEPECGPLP